MPDVNTSDVPWAMQIALRVEKSDPPSDIDACEAAARACVGLIVEAERRAVAPLAESDEAVVDTSWLEAVDAWRGIAIRKIVRRARGKRWDDAQTVPGFTCTQGRAEARAFVPAPVKPLPPELAKMQVEGTALPKGESTTENAMVTVRISPLVEMTSGKTAAQCAHAAQRAWEAMTPDERSRWANDGHRVQVVRDTEAAWATDAGRVSIIDAGFTELEGQHETTRANW